MGYGDFKLFAALLAWLGYQMFLPILLLSALTGAVTGIALIALGRHAPPGADSVRALPGGGRLRRPRLGRAAADGGALPADLPLGRPGGRRAWHHPIRRATGRLPGRTDRRHRQRQEHRGRHVRGARRARDRHRRDRAGRRRARHPGPRGGRRRLRAGGAPAGRRTRPPAAPGAGLRRRRRGASSWRRSCTPGSCERMEALCAASGGPYQVLVIPLLLESGLASRVDRVLVVDCSESVQRERLMVRDGESAAVRRPHPGGPAGPAGAPRRARTTCWSTPGPGTISQRRVRELHAAYLQLGCRHKTAGNKQGRREGHRVTGRGLDDLRIKRSCPRREGGAECRENKGSGSKPAIHG